MSPARRPDLPSLLRRVAAATAASARLARQSRRVARELREMADATRRRLAAQPVGSPGRVRSSGGCAIPVPA